MFPSGKQYIEESANNQETDMEVIPENGGESINGSHLMEDQTSLNDNCEEEISDLPLEYCMRIVPHDQDSGAFFIAVFQKLSPLPGNYSFPPSSLAQIGNHYQHFSIMFVRC